VECRKDYTPEHWSGLRKMIGFDKSVCSDFAQASSREWLETNGLGGFACSTITGMNTRRYHGLLTVATRPPVVRVLLLSKFEETIVLGDCRVDLSTNQYAGAVHPRGYELLAGFRLDPFPVFTFECEGARIEKSVCMVHDSNTTVVEYRVLEAPPDVALRLEVRPLLAFRDYHSITRENGGLDADVRQEMGLVSIAPYPDLPRLYLAHNASKVETQGGWYREFFYAVEAERGLDAVEDLFNPITLHFELGKVRTATLIASTEPRNASSAAILRNAEVGRRKRVADTAPLQDSLTRQLAVAADQFLVKRGDGYTLMAGYPWFADWGRDTMISLPGLIHLGNSATWIKQILHEYARHVDQGMIPNCFPEGASPPEFNSVDAALWFFEAARAYLAQTGDEAFLRDDLYEVLKGILDWHMRGTRYHVAMQEDGLLAAGEPGIQLTWMDAKVGDWVVTPRIGKPVEIQALWFNALKTMEELATRFKDVDLAKRYGAAASAAQLAFNRLFWNAGANCLYDVVGGDGPDAAIRPNQIFAISLHHSMLSMERAERVLEVVERELLTPYGLRSLSPRDPQYKGRYEGDPANRDAAYHQGTVWSWLLGPYITAFRKVNGYSDESRLRARDLLKTLEAHLTQAGLGQISEIFDGDEPHRPRGCFAQAWSVGEILRVLCEEVHPALSSGNAPADPVASRLPRASLKAV
jgi:predicted glycogen debranching enzyme